MALRPSGKGQKHKTLYSDVAWALDSMMAKGLDDKKASTSQATTTTIQDREGMTLWSGTRVEQKRTTETSLGLTIEELDEALAKSPEVRAKAEKVSMEGGYKGFFGMTTEETRDIEPPKRGLEGGEQMPTNEELRMLMVEEEEDEVLEHIIKPLTSRLMEWGLDPGYSVKRWTDCVQHLAYPSVYTGDRPLIKTLWRSKPVRGFYRCSVWSC
jgi:hypothetical protein